VLFRSVGPCFGGDLESVTLWSALMHVRNRGYEIAVCSVGPGIVGTASKYGHGGLAAVGAANAGSALGGRPVVVRRVSDADPRERHLGTSHHTDTILELCLGDVHVADKSYGKGWERACEGLPLSHMGRDPEEDPAFFEAAYAAGRLARELGSARP